MSLTHLTDTPVVLGPIGVWPRRNFSTFVHRYASVNKGVGVCVNTTRTTKPDPPHHSHMSPTQPHMHGKSTGGLHRHGLYHLPSHPTSHSALSLHSRIARSQLPYGSADELEGDRHGVGFLGTRLKRLSKQPDPQRPAIYRRGR